MTDIEIAKTELYEENLTLAIVKNGAVLYSTKSHRISGFLDAIDKCGENLEAASLADRVVGKAVALLCACAKIREVYAEVLSRKAMAVFKQNNIKVHWQELVDNILDAGKAGTCPFEKAAAEISEPKNAYKTFKGLRENLKACKP
jgi:hypothetical protein